VEADQKKRQAQRTAAASCGRIHRASAIGHDQAATAAHQRRSLNDDSGRVI